jgi:hypothetical protein
MTRDELIELLARLVAEGYITEEEAVELLARFDDDDLDVWGAPIPPPQAFEFPTGFDFNQYVATIAVAQSSAMSKGVRPQWPNSPNVMADSFARAAAALAAQLANRGITVAQWHADMRTLVTQYTVMQYVMGGRHVRLTPESISALRTLIRGQLGYLSRFADQVALGTLSEEAIAARAVQYGGSGRGEWYRQREAEQVGMFGMVVDYISRDDPRTCVPCNVAEQSGPYLPGEGPMPGQVCLGAGNCRCERVSRYDPAAYLQLTRS